MNFFANCWKNLLQLSAGDAVLTNSKLEISDATSKDDISQAGSQLSFLTSAPYLYTPSCNSLITKFLGHAGLEPIRSPQYTQTSAIPFAKFKRDILLRSVPHKAMLNSDYYQSRPAMITLMESTANALKFTPRTLVLGVQFLDFYMNTNGFRDLLQLKAFALAALLAAAKSGEKDERVPFINKLLRYAKEELLVKSIKEAELQICDFLDWHLQYGTGIDILEFYMVQGIFYANDISATTPKLSVDAKVLKEKPISSNFPPAVSQKNLPQSLQKPVAKQHSIFHKEVKENPIDVSFSTIDSELEVNKLTVEQVTKYEQDLITLVKDIVLDGFYLQFPNQNILASACIALHRKMIGATHFWNKNLAEMTGTDTSLVLRAANMIWNRYKSRYPVTPKQTEIFDNFPSFVSHESWSPHVEASQPLTKLHEMFETNYQTAADEVIE